MAITCPRCGAEYDVTLFAFGRSVQCDCGEQVAVSVGHTLPLDRDGKRAVAEHQTHRRPGVEEEMGASNLPQPRQTHGGAAGPEIQNTLPSQLAAARVLSIDALRGFDMFWIIGGDALAVAILNRSGWSLAPALADQLEHAEWEGFRFYDLIFPLFLFLVGCVLPYSLARYGTNLGGAYLRIARRTAALFLVGLVCNNALQFDWPNLRIAGVLQRIAICYGVAALLVLHLRVRGQLLAIATILLGYWAILAWVPVPGGMAGDFTKAGNLAGYLDRTFLPGKILKPYYGFGDNEGLLSTIPAVATALCGALAGQWLRTTARPWFKAGGLALAGVACLAVGYSWDGVFPIIKNLWTSSFVMVAGGWSLLLLALFYAVIDVMGCRRWAFLWLVIGVNPITIYVAQRFIDFPKMAQFFLGGMARLSGEFGPVVLLTGSLAAKWLFLWWLYRQRFFLRL